MTTIADRIAQLGGELAPPADPHEIAHLEARIGISLPEYLRHFLGRHNGSLKTTEEVSWNFFSCQEIATYSQYRNQDTFFPDNNSLREIDHLAKAVALPGSNLILFVDALIDAPTYGVLHLPGHRYDGMVFDASYGSLSATSFDEWIASFVASNDDSHPFIYSQEPESGPRE
jgi:hypothetical protein